MVFRGSGVLPIYIQDIHYIWCGLSHVLGLIFWHAYCMTLAGCTPPPAYTQGPILCTIEKRTPPHINITNKWGPRPPLWGG